MFVLFFIIIAYQRALCVKNSKKLGRIINICIKIHNHSNIKINNHSNLGEIELFNYNLKSAQIQAVYVSSYKYHCA